MGQLLGSCLGLVSGSTWKTVHTVFQSEFTRKASLKHVGLVQDQVLRQFNIIGHRNNMKKDLLDPASDLKMLPFWTIATVLYGPLTDNQRQTLEEIIPIREELFRQIIMGGGSRFSISKLFPSEGHKLLTKFKPLWKAFNDNIIVHGRTLDSQAPIFEMFTAVERGEINEEQFYQTLDEILFANLDVTTGALSWNLTLLALNPEYQKKLRREIQDAQKEGDIQTYLSNNGSLLASCVLESARVKAAAAFSVPQSAPTDRLVEGLLIPAGTNFIVDSYALNVANKLWADDGHIYRPERFEECSVSDLRYQYWRFGFGPRQCLGKYLADLILRTTIVHIITTYDLACLGEVGRNADVWISHPQTLLACTKRPRSTSN
jgi:cytochrome P450